METQKAIELIAEILDVMVGHFNPDCGGDFVPENGSWNDEGDISCGSACEYYRQCKQMSSAREINSKLQRLLADKESVHIWIDSWCKNNGKPGARAGWSVVAILNGKQNSLNKGHVPLHKPQTNNVAEYCAILAGLRWGLDNNRPITLHTDSTLVVGQVTQGWEVKAEHLMLLVAEVKTLVAVTDAKIVKEPREKIVEILGH